MTNVISHSFMGLGTQEWPSWLVLAQGPSEVKLLARALVIGRLAWGWSAASKKAPAAVDPLQWPLEGWLECLYNMAEHVMGETETPLSLQFLTWSEVLHHHFGPSLITRSSTS